MNEEEIRGKILLPFISDLGFDLSEISLEKTFTIRLGKSQHLIRGRSDILCKRNNQNLFIIELKSDSIQISQDDIDQGISYARALVDNIAPFTIVTNGKSTRIFDSISRLELTGKKISEHSDFWKNGFTLSTDEELRIRYEALKRFISLSSENLSLFCKNQVQDRLGPIVGGLDSPTSKFVEELYIQREDLLSAFEQFIQSNTTAFGIVGAAGVGKTNVMCSLALQSLDSSFVFFYNAALINKSPLEHIAQDLNVAFSSKSDEILVLKKLSELGRSVNKKVLLFIDAIDESLDSNLSLELSEIVLSVRNLENIKICLSCKSNVWESILCINGTHTHLFEELRRSHGHSEIPKQSPGYRLEDFRDYELQKVIPIYKRVFGFKGDISENLLNELRNGFFLRIFSEVYSHKQVPKKINDRYLIKEYLDQSLRKTRIGFQSCLRILSKLGSIFVNHSYNEVEKFYDFGINSETLLDNLNIALGDSLPEDLFARNILSKSNKADSNNISFYYSKIRDYIICFHSFKLDQLNHDDFYDILDLFFQNHIGQSAIRFYLEHASVDHRQAVIGFKKHRALTYVLDYDSYLNENFRSIKELFIPYTEGEIGIILPVDLKADGYALYPFQSNGSEKVLFENLENPFSKDDHHQRLSELGADTVHLNHTFFLKKDQKKEVRENIFRQLEKKIKRGYLSTYCSNVLLIEQVATIVYYYHKNLGYNSKILDSEIPHFQNIYPIDLEDLRRRVYKFRAYHHYGKRAHSSKIVDQMVDEAFQNNIDIPQLRISGDFPPFEELSKIVNILIDRGITELGKHYLPYPDISISESRRLRKNSASRFQDIMYSQYTEDQAKLFIERFLTLLERCYKEFIEYNFPTFKNQFEFYTTMPHEYVIYTHERNSSDFDRLRYCKSSSGQIQFHHKKINISKLSHDGEKPYTELWFSFDKFLQVSYHDVVKTIDRLNTRKVDEASVIRSWVHKLLKGDIKELFKENGVNI